MNYVKAILLMVAVTCQAGTSLATTPSMPRKALSTVAAPVATYSTLAGFGFVVNKLAQYMPVIGNGATLSGVRPYVAGLAAVVAWYNLATPLQQYYYTMFSGDTDRLDNAIQAIEINEYHIKQVLKDILLVKNDLERKSLTLSTFIAPYQSLNNDPIWVKLADALHGTPVDQTTALQALRKLAPAKDGTTEHWNEFALVKLWKSIKESVHDNVVYPWNRMSQNYDIASWNFKADEKLLVTWGGSRIKSAARDILDVYASCKTHITVETSQKFQDSARILIEYAVTVLEELKTHKNAIMRVRDLTSYTETAATVVGDGMEAVVDSIDLMRNKRI